MTLLVAMKTPKLQRHERTTYYHLPVHCGFCGKLVLDSEREDDDPLVDPCPHTLFVAHDEGFEYLSERAANQLKSKGYEVETDGDLIAVSVSEEGKIEDVPSFEELTDGFQFQDGLKVASYVGPPSGFGSYVGFAPLEDE